MLTVISTIIGFISPLFLKLFDFFQDKNDKAHELEIMDKQIALAQLKIGGELSAIGIQANAEADIARVNADLTQRDIMYSNMRTGITWIDALNALLRPGVAILFMTAYFAVMIPHFIILGHVIASYENYSNIHEFIEACNLATKGLWTENDDAIFASIISFLFGSRFLQNYNRGN